MAFGVQTSSLTSSTPSGFDTAEAKSFSYGGNTNPKTGLSNLFDKSSGQSFLGSFFEPSQPSVTMTIGNMVDPNAASQKTLMQTINPGTDYKATMPAGQITFDSDKAVTTGASAAQKVGAAEVSVDENKKQFTADFKDAREQLSKAIVEVAGYEKGAEVLKELGAFDQPQTKMGIAANAMMQSSPVFTALAVIAAVKSESSSEKRPSPQEVEQILAQARDLMVLNAKNDQEVQMSQISSGAPAPKEPEKKFNWEAANIDHLKALAAGRPEDQPEMVKLDQQQEFLADVRSNHKFVQENYGNVITADKIEAAGGQRAASDMDVAEEVIKTGRFERQLEQVVPNLDSPQIHLTGLSLQGLVMSNRYEAPILPTVNQVARTLTPEDRRDFSYDIAKPKVQAQAPNLFG